MLKLKWETMQDLWGTCKLNADIDINDKYDLQAFGNACTYIDENISDQDAIEFFLKWFKGKEE